MSIRAKRCLVLNASWFPIGIESLKNSITKLCNERAVVIAGIDWEGSASYQVFTFEEWIVKGVTEGADFIRTQHLDIEVPEIVKKPYNKLHVQKLPLKAVNIFARDGQKCWYCGSEKDLTIDHIIPKSKGGKNSWKNLITSCGSCNHAKGEIDVAKFCEGRKCKIPHPVNVGSFPWLKELGKKYPESWRKWLNL